MKLDRELLEAAAKAVGIDAVITDCSAYTKDDDGDYLVPWNPLADDGDAMRLAVKLNLPFRKTFNGTFETGNDKSGFPIWEFCEPDPLAAARRAIVRAAAEIGASL